MPKETREKLIGLLDYVEQVIRLDERVAFRLSDYRLPDGTIFAISEEQTLNLPNVNHDVREEDDSVWLAVSRLARNEPPPPPPEIADWVVISTDPSRAPQPRAQRMVTVSAIERDAMIARGEVRQDDVLEAPRSARRNKPVEDMSRYDLTLRLGDRPEVASAIDRWIAGPWADWAVDELPRRRTIALYQQLYKIFQMREASETPIELIWGIGSVDWQKDGRIVDRPLLEARVDIELDDGKAGLIRIRPTGIDPTFDLKPYEELGCVGLPQLSDLIRREIQRANLDGGLSPFERDSFEPILSMAAARLDPEGSYAPHGHQSNGRATSSDDARLLVSDKWVLFARPRSQHVVLQDIDRLRETAKDATHPISGLAERLVTEPSMVPRGEGWEPLGERIGEPPADRTSPTQIDVFDVFFPKPFNDDQIEIMRRLQSGDGLVVQGPPGTGKTHTIANLICHAMATGKRVLVTSHGESALTVLKDQLPKEVQPLAIAILSSERQGLRQIENAIREIQSIVEATRPEARRSNIHRMETEIVGLRQRLTVIDQELDSIAAAHLSKIGPRNETPAQLALRLVSERETHKWFVDRPSKFAGETALNDNNVVALGEARRRVGVLLDHLEANLPAPADLPRADAVRAWHEDLVRANELERTAQAGPVLSLRIALDAVDQALALANAVEALAATHPASLGTTWLEPFRRAAIRREPTAWSVVLRERLSEWTELDSQRVELARRSVELPPEFIANQGAREAVLRAAAGDRIWPILAVGKGAARALVNAIRLDGAPVSEGDIQGWRHVAAVISHNVRRHQITARWRTFAAEVGIPPTDNLSTALTMARKVIAVADSAHIYGPFLAAVTCGATGMDQLADDPDLCQQLMHQIRAAAGAARLAAGRHHINRTVGLFETGTDPTSVLVKRFVTQAIGNPRMDAEKIEDVWRRIVSRTEILRRLSGDFNTIEGMTNLIGEAGAPRWAQRLRTELSTEADPIWRANWRDAWDYAAADAKLSEIDVGDRLSTLSREREEADTRCRRLFAELVRERTFYELDRRLSPGVKAALVQFVVALRRIGAGTGRHAGLHRGSAREALARCYDAVPCWIMPTWRVAEQLPSELAAVDWVIIDEASQSDVAELPALLRGRKILVVGDDRQVSPTAPFVTQAKINQLRHNHLGDLPFSDLLEPGQSIYHLMRAVFPDERLMLKEHFRCVEPIIRFSMQFYPEDLLPLRVPKAQERIDPPLIDIFVPHGRREGRRRINPAEADVIVDEIMALTKQPGMERRSIGVISLIGSEQAAHIRTNLSEKIGEELMQRHAILCGDSATFQGTERDIVFLSMVADPVHRTALTMDRYEQRFNVAVSRARDRLVLVRSVRREDLNENDLKARLIAHFENPMPPKIERLQNGLGPCESRFERDMMQRLLDRGYQVQPQVGSLGYRIDLVVEGDNGCRLAVECDGDRFHGPDQWRDDMRRQRVLERVGWRFWRCFASSFYRDPDGTVGDLFETLSRMGVEPIQTRSDGTGGRRFTEHRVIDGTAGRVPEYSSVESDEREIRKYEIAIGDRLTLQFADDPRRISVRLTETTHDLAGGMLSSVSALGKAVREAEEGEEIEFGREDGTKQRVLIVSVGKTTTQDLPPQDSSGKESITNGSSAVKPKAAHANRPENVVVHREETQSGSFCMFMDGSIEIETAGEKQWYRDFAELERSRREETMNERNDTRRALAEITRS